MTRNGQAVTHHIAAPPYADGSRPCVFELENPGYAGSTAPRALTRQLALPIG